MNEQIDPRAILDEFTLQPLTRQRKYQLRRALDGCCEKCGVPVEMRVRCGPHGFVDWRPKLCDKHLDENRKRQRQRRDAGIGDA